MADLIYLIIGLIAGLVGGVIVTYLLPCRALQRANARLQTELTDTQTKNNELQATILEEQSRTYQGRQTSLAQQKRLNTELAQAHERITELEQQLTDLEERRAQEQQARIQEIIQLRSVIERLEQEQVALQDRFAEESSRWDRERQSLFLDNTQLNDQVAVLHREKMAIATQLEGQTETWEQERLALQIQVNTLEENLASHKPRADQAPPANAALLAEQAKAATAELSRQRLLWEKERRALRHQLEQVREERRGLEEQLATRDAAALQALGPDVAVDLTRQRMAWEKEKQELLNQVGQLQSERHMLEQRLAERDRNAERERGALETEIEQLMDRLLRLHREHSGN